jgi:hypothetical protein
MINGIEAPGLSINRRVAAARRGEARRRPRTGAVYSSQSIISRVTVKCARGGARAWFFLKAQEDPE